MPFSSLYQKYRPQTFSEIIGQPHVSRTLSNAVVRGHVFHAYLFSGPRGTGKTSTARILAKAVNCEKGPTPEPCGQCQACTEIAAGTFPDVFEIDAATHSKVEETRDFLSNVPTGLSALSRKKFYIIDEVHMLSSHAFNALLKTLEEPPEHIVFVLATTEPQKVPPTIAGRCQHFEFRLITPSELAEHYTSVCEKEGIDFEPEAIERVAALARGSVRDGLSILDQLIAATGGHITKESVSSIAGDDETTTSVSLARSIATGDIENCLAVVASLSESGKDFRSFTQHFAAYLRNLMVASYLPTRQTQAVAGVDPQSAEELAEIAKLMGRPSILRCLEITGDVLASMASGGPPQLAFELGVVRMCKPEEAPSLAELARRVEELQEKLVRLERKLASGTARGHESDRERGVSAEEKEGCETVLRPPGASDKEKDLATPKKVPEAASSPLGYPSSQSGTLTNSVSLVSQWEQLLSALKGAKKMKARALLQEARPVEIDGSTLIIEYPEKFEFHAKGAEALRAVIAPEMTSVFGSPLNISARVVSSDESGNSGQEAEDSGKNNQGSENSSPSFPRNRARAREIADKLIKEELGGTPLYD